MKYSKIFSALALAIIFSLFTLIIPPAPAMAAGTVIVSPTSGHVGTSITASGTGFTTGNYYTITFAYGTSFSQQIGSGTVGGGVVPATSYTVPEMPAGAYNIYIQTFGTPSESGLNTFTVTPKISLSPTSDYVGQDIAIDGTGFAASEDVTITFFTSSTQHVTVGTTSTDANGSFANVPLTVPESYRGSHTVKALDDSGKSDTTNFSTKQSIAVSPTSGAVGDEVTITGTGFGASKYMNITYDGDAVTTIPSPVRADANGSFTAKFTVPSCVKGTYEVKAREGTTTYVGTANFAVEAGASLSKTTGNVGTSLTVTGTGFLVNHSVTITYPSEPTTVVTTTTNASGAFSATFDAPVSVGGSHIITVTDGTNIKTLIFTMESTPPPIPAPLLPLMDVKTESEAYFDWEDVTDLSLPITYTLQIATDEDFPEDSIVLEKEGLTTSEYTITEEEKLESTEEEAPYYWRIKAIDGASNESGWSGTGSFYVSGFSLGGLFKYVFYVLGGLAILALGFWLGRRTAYY